MGPLQVLGMSVVERMYDGQMCLAQKFSNIVWQVLCKYYTSMVKHWYLRYCLARWRITGVSKMWITISLPSVGRQGVDKDVYYLWTYNLHYVKWIEMYY